MILPKIFFVNNCLGGLMCDADICLHREAKNKEQLLSLVLRCSLSTINGLL